MLKNVKFFCKKYKTIISKANREVNRPKRKFTAHFSDEKEMFLIFKELLQINIKKDQISRDHLQQRKYVRLLHI